MDKVKQYLPWTIRIIISVLFILSAVAKLYPSPNLALGTFEAKQLIPMGFSDGLAPYFSRLLIALEFALGLGILQPHFLRKIIVPATIGLLAVFCVHLTYSIATGAGGNCGCFGELIPMTPLQALIKNLISIVLLVVLYRLIEKDRSPNRISYLALLYTTSALVLFMIAPVQKRTNAAASYVPEATMIEDDFNSMVSDTTATSDTTSVAVNGKDPKTPKTPEVEKPKGPKKVTSKFSKYVPAQVKIDEGKKILCFFAPGCDHCQETAKILTKMRKADPNFPPIYIIFMDEETEKIPGFFTFAGAQYSHQVADVISFWEMIGMSKDTPGVAFLWNGNIRYFSDGINENAFSESKFKAAVEAEK